MVNCHIRIIFQNKKSVSLMGVILLQCGPEALAEGYASAEKETF